MRPPAVIDESIVRFGDVSQLVGVLSRVSPAPVRGAGAATPRVGVLLLNAGVIGRMGPHRFNVKVGRALAAQGHVALRFDLSGMGDSGRASGVRGHAEQAVQDICAAVDVLRRETDDGPVLVVGICSGANHAWYAALDDHRISGLVMIDSFAYPNSRTPLQYHLLRMRWRSIPETLSLGCRAVAAAPGRLGSAVRSLIADKLSKRDVVKVPTPAALAEEDVKPSVTAYAAHMQGLVDRDARLLLIYTGTWARYYSHASQFATTFGRYPFASRVRCEFIPQFDHTFTLISAQQGMIGRISQWIREQFPNLSEAATLAGASTTSLVPTEVEGPRSSVREPYPPMLAD